MSFTIDYNNMMHAAIGKSGIDKTKFTKDKKRIEDAFNKVIKNRGTGWQEWTELPFASDSEIEKLESELASIKNKCDNFVVLGIGGSALGPLSVFSALFNFRHNELSKEKRNGIPKYFVEDNIDPERMTALLEVIDLKTTYFNVITKSGETSETLAQFLIIYKLLKDALGEKEAKQRIIVTTTIGKGTAYNIAKKEGFKVFGIGEGIGGRFSVFSSVGLVPFAIMGINIKKLLKGARDICKNSEISDINKNLSLLTAYLQVVSMENGKNISVMMPYADSLKFMADFYCQLWGESLGKAFNLDGKLVNVGQTPAKSLGVTDQHSQIQLYVEGPLDKVISFITAKGFKNKVKIPNIDSIDALEFLKGGSLENLLRCEFEATRFALAKAGRSNFTIELGEVNEESVGALLQYFMYKTAFAGALLNIDTYNQPGVEEGKKATFAMLNRKGYEDKLKEITSKKGSKDSVVTLQ